VVTCDVTVPRPPVYYCRKNKSTVLLKSGKENLPPNQCADSTLGKSDSNFKKKTRFHQQSGRLNTWDYPSTPQYTFKEWCLGEGQHRCFTLGLPGLWTCRNNDPSKRWEPPTPWQSSGVPTGVWGFKPPPPPKFRSFDKAELNSQFHAKYIRNCLVFLFHHLN
jgi:hypothetical protein